MEDKELALWYETHECIEDKEEVRVIYQTSDGKWWDNGVEVSWT